MELLERVCMAPVTRRTRQPAPRQDSGLVKRVWLLLYAEGGTWTEKEIRVHLHRSDPIRATLTRLVDRGYLARNKRTNIDGESAVKYGVDRRCKVPQGVTVDELWEILQMTAANAKG